MSDEPGIQNVSTGELPPAEDGSAREQWTSAELLGSREEVLIQHGGEIYRLRRTRQGKLILYK